MAVAAVSAVVGRIGDLAVQETSLLCNVTGEVGLLKNELQRLQGFLEDADNQMRSGNKTIAVCVHQLRDASYEAENIIEAAEYVKKRSMLKKGCMGAISRYAGLPSDLVSLHKVDSQIRDVRKKISQIKDDMSALNVANLGVSRLHNIDDDVHIWQSFEDDDDVVVGFEDEYREIVGKLLEQRSSLSVTSLVAMGGAGKTTLARKVYNSSRVKQHFKQVIWVAVSQNLKVIDLLNGILKQIEEVGDPLEATDKKEEGKVGKKIHDSLLGKRYLLVLDDLWQTNTWEQIKRSVKVFPDDKNGSRVLLTTRKEDVASQIQMPTYIHHLKLLSKEKSWELFSRKALPSYNRSKICDLPKFEKLGRKLAKKCNGLPLALTVLGGYLSKNPNIEAWSDLLLGWTSIEDGQMMGNILARSYNDLSDSCLKSCLLFLASFPEDYEIPMSDLIELWIAECFIIPHTRSHTLEETARTYVKELAQRSLVQVHGRSKATGWTAMVRIHDILRDWCIEEARRDGFLGVTDKTGGRVAASSSDTMTSYRYCFQDFCDDQVFQATPNLRTLIGFRLSPLSLPKLRFLRVLHLENSTVWNLSMLIGGCIHLRCLRLRKCTSVTLPSSITKLLYLQTIDLRETGLKSLLPNTMWAISTLRHVYLSSQSYPAVNTKQDLMQILEKLPCLVVLHLFNHQGLAMSSSAQGFPQLRELELGGYSTEWRIEEGAMPMLSHLTLWSWNMSKLPEGLMCLPSLVELELVDMQMIRTNDITWKTLEGKGCKVKKFQGYRESEEQRKKRLKEEERAKAIMRQANRPGWLPCSTKI